MSRYRRRHRSLIVFERGDVAFGHHDVRQVFPQCRDVLCGSIKDSDTCSFRQKTLDDGAADPGRATCDERTTSIEPSHESLPLVRCCRPGRTGIAVVDSDPSRFSVRRRSGPRLNRVVPWFAAHLPNGRVHIFRLRGIDGGHHPFRRIAARPLRCAGDTGRAD